MTPRLITRTMLGIAAFLALAAAWWLLAPTQIGGRVTYVTISGTSMEPGLSTGDLAVTRSEPSYEVGDAVLYRSEQLRAPVLHRIVAVDGSRFVLRGDNRTTDDPETPAAEQVVGRLWFSLPYVGRAAAVVHEPLYLACFAFLLALLVLAGGREVSRRRAPRPPRPVRADPPHEPGAARRATAARTTVVVGVAGAALCACLALVGWSTSPSRERSTDGGYAHAGVFSYSADVPRSTVYPTGRISTGETAFTRLVRAVDVSFDYRLDSNRRLDTQGGIDLDAVVSDDAGWSHTVPLRPGRAFDGSAATVDGVLDLGRLSALTEQMRELTGSTTSTFSVDVVPHVRVVGRAGSTRLDDEFAPALPFTLDATSLRLDSGDSDEVLAPVEQGQVTETVPSRVGVGRLSLATTDARAFGTLGLAVFLALTAIGVLLLAHGLHGPAPERIAARYAGRVVDAHAVVPDGRFVSDVGDIESLVRIADHYDRVVLHVAEGGLHTYLVDDGIGVYRFRLGTPRPTAAPVSVLPRAR